MVQLQILLISITHSVQIVSNMPSTVTWSYKSPLRYLFYILQDLANPYVLPISHLDTHLPEVAVVDARLALLCRTADLMPLPSVLPASHTRYG